MNSFNSYELRIRRLEHLSSFAAARWELLALPEIHDFTRGRGRGRERQGDVMVRAVPERTTAALAAAQRPIDASAFTEKVTAAAWKTLPSTFVIGREDRAIAPDELRFMACRAHGRVVEINASHLGLISHAGVVANAIRRAAQKRSGPLSS